MARFRWVNRSSISWSVSRIDPTRPSSLLVQNCTFHLRWNCSTSKISSIVIRAKYIRSLKARFIGPPWGPPGADRAQVGPMLAPWILLLGYQRYCGSTATRPCSRRDAQVSPDGPKKHCDANCWHKRLTLVQTQTTLTSTIVMIGVTIHFQLQTVQYTVAICLPQG